MLLLKMACPGCKLVRFPDQELVKKGKKTWLIRTCRVCKYKDLEEYTLDRRNREDD